MNQTSIYRLIARCLVPALALAFLGLHFGQAAKACEDDILLRIERDGHAVEDGYTYLVPFVPGKTADDYRDENDFEGSTVEDKDIFVDVVNGQHAAPEERTDNSHPAPYWGYNISGTITDGCVITATCYWEDDNYLTQGGDYLPGTNDTPNPTEDRISRSIYIVVYRAELKSISFTSDHGLLKKNPTSGSVWGDSTESYESPEWVSSPARSNPISQTMGTALAANVTVRVAPSGLNFTLTGAGNEGIIEWGDYYDFSPPAAQATGGDQAISVTAEDPLPSKIKIHTPSIEWRLQIPNSPVDVSLGTSQHTVYVTYGTPTGSDATLQRVSTVCAWANDKSTPEGIADDLQDGVAEDTHFGPGDVDGWALMAGGYGDCDNQARLMKLAFEMLGAGSAEVRFVRASEDAGAGNCLNYETRTCPVHGQEYLLLDFYGGGQTANMNQYEGTCYAPNPEGKYYAITPTEKSSSDYDMLQDLGDLGATQRWCYYVGYPTYWFVGCNQPESSPPIP